MRCIYQSIAMRYKYTFETLSSITGKKYKTIHMFGGGIKDTLLCKMTASGLAAFRYMPAGGSYRNGKYRRRLSGPGRNQGS